MVVAMDDVSFEVRKNLVITVYVGFSTFNKWVFRVHSCKCTCTCTRHGDAATTEGHLGLVGSGVRQGRSGDIDGVAVVVLHQWRLGETDRRANMQWGVGGNEGVDELTSAPRCTFTLLLMFPDDSGNKQTAGLDGREAVGPVIVGGSSEAVRTVSMLTTETGGRIGLAIGSGSGAKLSRAGQRGKGERRALMASA